MNRENIFSLVALGLFVLLAVGTTGDDESESSSGGSKASASSEGSSEGSGGETYSVGEEFKVGDFAYTIDKISKADVVGNEFTKSEPSDGATFVIVEFTERNDGKEAETAFGSPMKFKDSQGRTFEVDSDALGSYKVANDDIEAAPKLQPGVKKKNATVFEIPKKAAKGSAKLVVSGREMLSDDEAIVEIDLPKEKEG